MFKTIQSYHALKLSLETTTKNLKVHIRPEKNLNVNAF